MQDSAVSRTTVIKLWWRYALEAVKVMIVHRGGSGRSFRLDPAALKHRQALKSAYIKLWIRKLTTVALDAAASNSVSCFCTVASLRWPSIGLSLPRWSSISAKLLFSVSLAALRVFFIGFCYYATVSTITAMREFAVLVHRPFTFAEFRLSAYSRSPHPAARFA